MAKRKIEGISLVYNSADPALSWGSPMHHPTTLLSFLLDLKRTNRNHFFNTLEVVFRNCIGFRTNNKDTIITNGPLKQE